MSTGEIPFFLPEDLTLDPVAQRRLSALEGRHTGDTAFIVGNGPSLKTMPLHRLAGRWFFGVNRGYLAYSLGLPPIPYYVIADQPLYRTYANEIQSATVGQRLYQANVCRLAEYSPAEDAIAFPFRYEPSMEQGSDHFATDATQGLFRGFTVALTVAQLAYYMGFHTVYLVGCDLSYDRPDQHFYAADDRWPHRVPTTMARILRSFETARQTYERNGRRLVNVTPGSALRSLPTDDFERVTEPDDALRRAS